MMVLRGDWCKSETSISKRTGWNLRRTIIFECNYCNLDDTNLTTSLKRHGPKSSRSNIQTKGPNKGRNEVMEGRLPFMPARWTQSLDAPLQNFEAFVQSDYTSS